MASRQCFPCTACCEGWLVAEINGVKMKPGTPCVHCSKQGCNIYAERPENPCVSFKCGWLLSSGKLPDHMKPSECGAIVLFDKWRNRQIIKATPAGETIPGETLDWLMAFAREYSLPLVFSEHLFEDGKYVGLKRTGYGPPSFIHFVETQIMPEDIMQF